MYIYQMVPASFVEITLVFVKEHRMKLKQIIVRQLYLSHLELLPFLLQTTLLPMQELVVIS